jgi:hypothetical protein
MGVLRKLVIEIYGFASRLLVMSIIFNFRVKWEAIKIILFSIENFEQPEKFVHPRYFLLELRGCSQKTFS